MEDVAPQAWHTITPRIYAEDALGLIRFIQNVFDPSEDSDRKPSGELWIGDSLLLVSRPEVCDPMPAALFVYVPDVDAVFARAVAAGATLVEEPRPFPHGARRATFRDAWGNFWQIARRGAG